MDPTARPPQASGPVVTGRGRGTGTVVVTGASQPLAAALVRALAASGSRRVVALDERTPREDLGGARFVRVDLSGPSLARVLVAEQAATVVDLGLLPAQPGPAGARAAAALASLQLLSAVQRAACVRRLVLASTTGVYGAGPRDPAVRTEDSEATVPPTSGRERTAVEVEASVRAFARRRSDLSAVVLRLADVVGPGVRTPLGDWLELPAVPVVVGHDPRLQVLHADDAVRALVLAAEGEVEGVVNVAGDGVLTLSQAAALCGRVVVPVPSALVATTARAVAGRLVQQPWSDGDAVLRFGRVVDTGRMRADLGLEPTWTSRGAVEDLTRGRGLVGPLSPELRDTVLAPLRGLGRLLRPRERPGA